MRIIGYGHSWIDGDGASSPAASLAGIVSRRLGWELDNRAVGGSRSTGTAALVRTTPPPPAAAYLLMTGLNDLRLGGDSPSSFQQFSEAAHTVLAAFRAASPGALILVIAQPKLLDFSRHAPHNHGSNVLVESYNAELRRIAADHPSVRMVEATGWEPGSMVAADTVHPNDSGHACLADAAIHEATAAWRQ